MTKSTKFPDAEMIAAGWIDKEDVNPDEIFCAMLENYRARTGIDLADVSEKLASGTHVLVPAEPTQDMIYRCSSAMKDFIRSMPPEEKQRRWGKAMKPKNGYRLHPDEKAMIRYRAMIRAAK